MAPWRFLALFYLTLPCAPWAAADEIRVFAAGAAKHALASLGPVFQRATGHQVKTEYDTVGALRDRLLNAPRGERADLVILSDGALASLRAANRLSQSPSASIGRVEVAVAVKQGIPLPDLHDPDALRQTLLAAAGIAYGDPSRGATAGTHFSKVIDSLDLRNALREKITILPFGVDVITGVAQGRYALGISQSSEIMQHEGVRYAGPLPAPHGLSTAYSVALTSENEAARQLLAFLLGPQALAEFAASGFVQPP